MPNRILRDGILTSERVNALSERAELFYRRLMSVVDDFGRTEAHPKNLLAKCYPFQLDRYSLSDVSDMLSEVCQMTAVGGQMSALVSEYEVCGKKYLQINNFGQRERASKYPAPPVSGQMSADDGDLRQPAARASNSTPTPPLTFEVISEENQEAKTALVLTNEVDQGLFEDLLGLFIALGRGVTIGDKIRCQNEWFALQSAERKIAHRFARVQLSEWQTRQTSMIPQPWNYLRERHWERAAPRLLQQTRAPTRREEAHSRAAEEFMQEAN